MSLFSERLKTLRKQRGFSNQKTFAEALKVSQQSVSLYERGARDPLPPILIKMAETLGTTADYLIGRTDEPEPPRPLSEDEQRFLDAYRRGDMETVGHLLAERLRQYFAEKGIVPGDDSAPNS
jgi:transcriptional regulator with XRE-family HTH domain